MREQRAKEEFMEHDGLVATADQKGVVTPRRKECPRNRKQMFKADVEQQASEDWVLFYRKDR